MNSKNKMFGVLVESNEEVVKHIVSPERKTYLIAERESPFLIKMVSKKNENDVYGAQLYIDGKLVNGLKTFKKQGTFFGIKMGNCNYREFVFDIPLLDANTSNSLQSADEFGMIKILFFSTTPVLSKKKLKILHRREKLHPSTREDGKKFFMRSVTVSEGNHFKIHNSYRDYLDSTDGDRILENYINYNDQIDEIKIHYSDFVALQIMGVISLKNKSHLHLIPKKTPNINYAFAAIHTLISYSSDKKMPIESIEEEFRSIVGHSLRIYMQEKETVDNFIRKNFKHFHVGPDGQVSMTHPEIFHKKMIPWDFNQKDYIISPKTTRYSTSHSKIEYITLDSDDEDLKVEDTRKENVVEPQNAGINDFINLIEEVNPTHNPNPNPTHNPNNNPIHNLFNDTMVEPDYQTNNNIIQNKQINQNNVHDLINARQLEFNNLEDELNMQNMNLGVNENLENVENKENLEQNYQNTQINQNFQINNRGLWSNHSMIEPSGDDVNMLIGESYIDEVDFEDNPF